MFYLGAKLREPRALFTRVLLQTCSRFMVGRLDLCLYFHSLFCEAKPDIKSAENTRRDAKTSAYVFGLLAAWSTRPVTKQVHTKKRSCAQLSLKQNNDE